MKRYSAFLVFVAIAVVTISIAVSRSFGASYSVEFELTNQFGQRITENNLRGKPLLVFFGFTHCNHVCPVGMQRASYLTTALDTEIELTPVFVSVDAARDSVEVVAKYVGNFHSRFIGLTGSAESLKAAADSFNTNFVAQQPDGETDYDIAHSSGLFLVADNLQVATYLPASMTVEDSMRAIRGSLGIEDR